MNEIVKYRNEMNEIRLTKFSAMDLDMLMLLCAKMKKHETEELVFSFLELKETLGISRKSDKEFLDVLERMNHKLNDITCHIRTETRRISFTLFPTLDANSETKTLVVSVNPKFSFLLNELSKNFTRFELSEFIKLESKYSKNLYRLLKQYRRTGTYTIAVDQFRELMDCPKSYPNKIFMRDCVAPAVDELSHGYFDDLEVHPIRARKKGAPITAYEFTFKPSDQVPGQMRMEDYAGVVPEESRPKKKPVKAAKTKFSNFPEREYDDDYYTEIERSF